MSIPVSLPSAIDHVIKHHIIFNLLACLSATRIVLLMERANNDLVKVQLLVIEKFKDKQRTNTIGNDCNFVYSLWPRPLVC